MKSLFIITGANGGIGSAVLKKVEEGTDFTCCALVRNLSKINIRDVPDRTRYIEADFSSPEENSFEKIFQWLECEADQADRVVLMLAASMIMPIGRIGTLGRSEDNISVNVLSQVILINGMVSIAEKYNLSVRIIQLDSGAAYCPIKGWALYCSAKAYLSMFLQVLSEEHREYEIVLLDPGVVDTKMQRQIRISSKTDFPDVDMFQAYKTDGVLKSPQDVAQRVLDQYILNWRAGGLKERIYKSI